ncbi:hypothetical protein L9W92_10550 [Pelotomaculum terephthalicicum JT]|nr:hypothetical protein [Pelotomaculum terephthalicicum]MCG9968491.1 hypothetical protein [Pelotomaculum terephthalicicum JT]OPX88914.1 MAG: hypothetical protein A4E54_01176 [Pelotomaculum sp. PtaB.Bin117]
MIPFVGWAGIIGKFINKTDAVIDVAKGTAKPYEEFKRYIIVSERFKTFL